MVCRPRRCTRFATESNSRRFQVTSSEAAQAHANLGVGPPETAVLYAGAHGISHGRGAVVNAATKLQAEPVRFVFVGGGVTKNQLGRRVR